MAMEAMPEYFLSLLPLQPNMEAGSKGRNVES
jgi:hypothetical protein